MIKLKDASKKLYVLLAFVFIFILQGCATTASDPQFNHKDTPSERTYNVPYISAEKPSAIVHVMRDSQFKGSAMDTIITLNGKDLATIQSGEKILFKIEPGEHLLGIKYLGNDPVLGALTLGLARPKRFAESATQFEDGKIYYFRIIDNSDWEWELRRSSQ
jgi:hypothetical protein